MNALVENFIVFPVLKEKNVVLKHFNSVFSPKSKPVVLARFFRK